ncbi:MAG: DEAD/DEAH box helicase [Parachlamydia sp.]|nr:DEAD/DEAH box helicase [Parachlamydia sp.]
MHEINKAAVATTTTAKINDTRKISSDIIADENNLAKAIKLRVCENISIESLPEDILPSIVAANTFKNPKYESNEKHGYSNWQTPEFLKTYRYIDGDMIVPLGYGTQLLQLCKEAELKVEIEDLRIVRQVVYLKSLLGVKLRMYQQQAVNVALKAVQGVVVSPTGSGKSPMGCELIRRRGQKSLILLHRSDLGRQWVEGIRKYLGLEAGLIGDGQWSIGEQITVAMVQTLASRSEQAKELAQEFGLILVDECHHVPAETFLDVLGWFHAKYRYGLSATLGRADGLMPLIFLGMGPQIASIERKEVEKNQATVIPKVKAIDTGFKPGDVGSWNEYLDAMATSIECNLFIFELAKQQKAPTLILCDRIAHADDLDGIFTRRGVEHAFVHGKVKDRESAMEQIKQATLTIGTTGLLGEGLDVPFWEVLIMASPISSEIKLMQAIGRVVRAYPGKKNALIYDLRDDCGFSGASFKKRFEIYKKHKIFVEFKK